jgi:hypothetical protein
MYAQTELLFEVWHRWQQSSSRHVIWNISTKLCQYDVDTQLNGLTMRQSMEYRNQKMALELAHAQLNSQPSQTKMVLIRPGSVKTQPFSEPNSIPASDYVAQVLSEQDVI